ncbi:hypothetical protein [Paraherbaspirillum soli]|uniref:Uncharacterized protein n=1 Tax=Paraherbaspirillum soli TaxID=631222 RepID=A0ABW0M9S1_9BURK
MNIGLGLFNYDHTWFKNGKIGPMINNPEIAGNDIYSCVDTVGFFCARYNIAKAADKGIDIFSSHDVTVIINKHTHRESYQQRYNETAKAWSIIGE